MKSSLQWTSVQSWTEFCLQWDSNTGSCDTHCLVMRAFLLEEELLSGQTDTHLLVCPFTIPSSILYKSTVGRYRPAVDLCRMLTGINKTTNVILSLNANYGQLKGVRARKYWNWQFIQTCLLIPPTEGERFDYELSEGTTFPTRLYARPVTTQISLRIHTVWSEFSVALSG